ncbi:CARDB protein, partial [Flexibacter flexilis DSM 6793]
YYILVDDIQIEALVPNNVGITSILAPSGACGTLTNSTVIKVGIKNIGTSAQTSIPVHYSINNGVVVTETFTGNLASGAVTDYTFTTTADFTNIGTYNVVAWTSLAGDVVINNDSADIVYHTGFVPVDFTGFNGTNISTVFPGWSEANGYIYPGGTTSAWGNNSAIFENNTVAYVNLYSTGKNEWFVSPSFKAGSNDGLSFKVALRKFSANGELSAMGSDDTLAVKVSTDCGATWTNIYNITATNAPTSLELTEFAASLAAYAGQNIQVAVVATEGVTNDEEDYNVYLDDVKLILLAPNDLGVKRIISPSSNCGLGNQATISVKLRNFGTASQSNFPVKYSVNNLVVTETFTGTLSAGDSVTYDFSTPASVSSAQVYNITSWTNLDGDANGMNNGASITLTRYGSPLSVVTFANYAFDNVIGEGWSEAIGGTSVQGDSPWKTGGISGN